MSLIVASHFSKVWDQGQWHWIPQFQPQEMADRLSGELKVDPAFMDWLLSIRLVYDRPMKISSGYRSEGHPKERNKPTPGAHTAGQAADILVYGRDALDLISIACNYGVMGLGINQTGDHAQRYIHLDLWSERKESVVWSY